MITRTTLKAVWLAGGGVFATWLAVSPQPNAPVASGPAATERSAVTREPSAEELNVQADRLRVRVKAVAPRTSTRNPFRFSAPESTARRDGRAPLPDPPAAVLVPAVALPPSLTLAGVAERHTPDGVRRTAVLSGNEQIYLVGAGDSVAGLYTVVAVDPEAVLLRDSTGAEFRLALK